MPCLRDPSCHTCIQCCCCYALRHPTGSSAQVSTVLGVTIEEQREEKAWTEGVAIWVAVLVVSLVGESENCLFTHAAVYPPSSSHQACFGHLS